MSVEVADLVAKLRAEPGNFTETMKRAEESFKRLGESSHSTMGKVSNVGLAIGGIALAIGAASARSAADYQELTTTLVTGAGESVKNLEEVKAGMLELAGQVGVSAQDLAKAMYPIESAGFHGAAGLEVLKYSAEGAKVGMANQADVANGLTTVLKDYHLKASDAAGVTGQMIAAVAAGKMHMGDFSNSLSKVLPIASAMHISFQQIAAAEATMTAHGVDAARAATAIQAGLMQLINPSARATAAMRALHLPIKEMQNDLATGNLTGALTLIQKAMKGAADSGMSQANQTKNLVAMFGGVRGGALALNLIPNMSEYKADLNVIGTTMLGSKNLAKNWALVQEDLNVQLSKFQASLGTIGIIIGTMLLPPLTQIATALSPIVQDFAKWSGQHPAFVKGAIEVGLAIGGIALAMKAVGVGKTAFMDVLKLVTLGKLGGSKKGGGIASDILGGSKTAVMNVTADIVNIHQGSAAKKVEEDVASQLKRHAKDVAPAAATLPWWLRALPLAARVTGIGTIASYGLFGTSDASTTQHGTVPQRQALLDMENSWKGSKGETWQTLINAGNFGKTDQLSKMFWKKITAGDPELQGNKGHPQMADSWSIPGFGGSGGGHQVVINVHPGAVVLHGAANDPTIAKQIGQHLGKFVQDALSAAKSTAPQAARGLPGMAGMAG